MEYKINLLAPAVGDQIGAVGTVLKAGRTLTVCRLEVFGIQGRDRSLVATGQPRPARVRPVTFCGWFRRGRCRARPVP
ncbi:hypothetical protein ACIBJE_03595 [Micromonospora sp. NPDC050187]|uniref:hypothetical protein n=1 Tax=Micromonospora sp. NPDC050187 TaxID=3364277 RepID=UPI0037BD37E8